MTDPLSFDEAKRIGLILLIVFLIGAMVLALVPDPRWQITMTLALFMLCSKLVLEQYLTWPMPWLIILGMARTGPLNRSCLVILAGFSLIGVVDNESFHPLGRSAILTSAALAVLCVLHILIGVRSAARSRTRLMRST